ncbi:WIAG-tail domain [Chengkuizengella axinellae]|uniref:WIAG-tail domain n=1 Tax=Chengkuizengella axinellae TaxID=3064388 RepID=A0ABT9IUY6_9BACL|nr:WIAG-tail domain [Chengkuizengella sp. 2205SS18-9]MDP5272640.1 WIAG-tail domain [Chengkuizengella sp. 2205SS18-9]
MKKRKKKNVKRLDANINELDWIDEKDDKEGFLKDIPIELGWFPEFPFLNDKPKKSMKKKKVKRPKPLLYTNPFEFSIEYNSSEDRDSQQPDFSYEKKEEKEKKIENIQQFNNTTFEMESAEVSTEVFIEFDEPFNNNEYVLVAMTNRSNCFTAIKEKTADFAVIEVIKLESEHHNENETIEEMDLTGELSWIAIGN